jgi:diguanylate cyclase (GGDEF)-like protein
MPYRPEVDPYSGLGDLGLDVPELFPRRPTIRRPPPQPQVYEPYPEDDGPDAAFQRALRNQGPFEEDPFGEPVTQAPTGLGQMILKPFQEALNVTGAGGGVLAQGALELENLARNPSSIFDYDPDGELPILAAAAENMAGRPPDEPASFMEDLGAMPGPGQVLAEAALPGRRPTIAGRVAKRVGGLTADVVLDPGNLATGGIPAAGAALRAGKPIDAAARLVGSAPAALIYAPQVAEGVVAGAEATGAALGSLPEDEGLNWQAAIEPAVETTLLAGLGYLMGKGVVDEHRAGRPQISQRPGLVVPEVVPPGTASARPYDDITDAEIYSRGLRLNAPPAQLTEGDGIDDAEITRYGPPLATRPTGIDGPAPLDALPPGPPAPDVPLLPEGSTPVRTGPDGQWFSEPVPPEPPPPAPRTLDDILTEMAGTPGGRPRLGDKRPTPVEVGEDVTFSPRALELAEAEGVTGDQTPIRPVQPDILRAIDQRRAENAARAAEEARQVPKDPAGNRVLPGQEDWTPEQRSTVHAAAEAIVGDVEAGQLAQPAGRYPQLGGPAQNSVEGYYGIPSAKRGTPLEDLPYTPAQMREALARDKGNPIELAIHDAVARDPRVVEALEPAPDPQTALALEEPEAPAYAPLPEEAPFEVDSTPRGADRRSLQEWMPADMDRRRLERRARVAEETGLDADDVLVEKIVALEERAEAAEDARDTDSLTRIPSRFAHERALARGDFEGHASLDLAGLKRVNDTLGHDAGDQFLRQAAAVMGEAAEAAGGRIFRRGGDEFAIGARDEGHAREVARAVKAALAGKTIEYVVNGKVVDSFPGARVDFGYAGGRGEDGFKAADQQLGAYRERAERLPVDHPEHRAPYRRAAEDVRDVAPEPPAGREAPPDQPVVAAPEPSTAGQAPAGPSPTAVDDVPAPPEGARPARVRVDSLAPGAFFTPDPETGFVRGQLVRAGGSGATVKLWQPGKERTIKGKGGKADRTFTAGKTVTQVWGSSSTVTPEAPGAAPQKKAPRPEPTMPTEEAQAEAAATFREHVERAGVAWPIKASHPEYARLKSEFDSGRSAPAEKPGFQAPPSPAESRDLGGGWKAEKGEGSNLWSVINPEGQSVHTGTDVGKVLKTADDIRAREKAAKEPAAPKSGNTVFTDDAAEKARAVLRAKLSKPSVGIDPEVLQAGITLAGYHVEKGARTFAAFAKAMLDDLGDVVKPYLKSWYMAIRYDPRASAFVGEMDDGAAVDRADLDAPAPRKPAAGQASIEGTTRPQSAPTIRPEQGFDESPLFTQDKDARERDEVAAQTSLVPAFKSGDRVVADEGRGVVADVNEAHGSLRIFIDGGKRSNWIPISRVTAETSAPVKVETPADLEAAGARVDPEPTPGQIEAGNYRKGHIQIHGLDVSIETAKGGTRSAKDGSWKVDDFPAHYGYVRRTEGADGEQVDVYVGDAVDSGHVFIVDQADPKSGEFDEHKVLLGFPSLREAMKTYQRAFTDGSGFDRVGEVKMVTVDDFKDWLRDGDLKEPYAGDLSFPLTSKKPAQPARAEKPLSAKEREKVDALLAEPEGSLPKGARVRVGKKEGTVVSTASNGRVLVSLTDDDGKVYEQFQDRDKVQVLEAGQPLVPTHTPGGKVITPQIADGWIAGVQVEPLLKALDRAYAAAKDHKPEVNQPALTSAMHNIREAAKVSTKTDRKIALLEQAWRSIQNQWPDLADAVDSFVSRLQRKGDALGERPAAEPAHADTPAGKIATRVTEALTGEQKITAADLDGWAREAFGGTRGGGQWTPKDAYDAMELGVNRWIAAQTDLFTIDPLEALSRMDDALQLLPTQTARTDEMVKFQQFSTPPTLAFVAAHALAMRPGDLVLEPSAGTGGLASFAAARGAELQLNELSPRRAGILAEMFPDAKITNFDGEHLHALAKDAPQPDLVLMNPPFSATAGRTTFNATRFGAKHVGAALTRLKDGGRLVAIVGEGMKFPKEKTRVRESSGEAFREWWGAVMAKYNVRANIGIKGEEYGKYGTTFPNQIIVIDKTGPTPGKTWEERLSHVAQGSTLTVEEALGKLDPIRRGRPSPSVGRPAGAPGRDVRGGQPSAVADAGPGRPGVAGGPARAPEPGASPRAGAASRPGGDEPGRPAEAGRPAAGERAPEHGDVEDQPAAPAAPAAKKPAAPLTYDHVQSKGETEAVDASGVFSLHEPAVRVPGAPPHPAEIVQTTTLAVTPLPPLTYRPAFSLDLVMSGALSEVQLESIVLAGQAHGEKLPDGRRKGVFIGDGTGLGKGREIAGILLDNWNQGRKRAVWLSLSRDLFEDAKRDLGNVAGGDIPLRIQADWNAADPIDMGDGVLFTNYATLVSDGKDAEGAVKTRLEQITNWMGEEPVIIFDEAHAAKNAVAPEGMGGGKDGGSQRGKAVLDLGENRPDARVAYVSATGATEPRNMGYMGRLGLWGEGTPFPSFDKFLYEIESGGIGAMEIVARDAKALGVYNARQISYRGVEYGEISHDLTDQQRDMYNTAARAWQKVVREMETVIKNSRANARTKSRAMSAFWSANQRFWSQLITSFKMPSVIRQAEASLKNGESVIVTLINTLEGRAKEGVAKANLEGADLDDLDVGPKDALMGFIRDSFPVGLNEEYTDPETGHTSTRPVLDANGKQVDDPEAVEVRDALLAEVSRLAFPEGPLDVIVNHFGPDGIAEVSGRKNRLVRNKKSGKNEWLKRSSKGIPQKRVNIAEMASFNGGEKRVAVITAAGAQGISLHSDKTFKNKQRRRLIMAQLPWQADTVMQFFGRGHRSGQVVAPAIDLASSNVGGERRFSSTAAARLASMGALGTGERRAAGAGELAKYNYDSEYGQAAVGATLKALARDLVKGSDSGALYRLGYVKEPGSRNVDQKYLTDIKRFLNRVLGLEMDEQSAVVEFFHGQFEAAIERAKEAGTFDEGVTDLKGDNPRITKRETVATFGNAKTEHIAVEVDRKIHAIEWDQIKKVFDKASIGEAFFYRNRKSGKVALAVAGSNMTLDDGSVTRSYKISNPRGIGVERVEEAAVRPPSWDRGEHRNEVLSPEAAAPLWKEQRKAIPLQETVTEHVLGGVLLPVWDRIRGVKGMEGAKIVRTVARGGERVVGMLLPAKHVDAVLRAVGASVGARTPEQVHTAVMAGTEIALAAGHRLARRRVAGEQRIEFIPKDRYGISGDELSKMGVITEMIAYDRRYFVPNEVETGGPVLEKLLKRFPELEAEKKAGGLSDAAERARERIRERGKGSTANDLGSAAAAGVGTLRDLGIIGADMIARGLDRFADWGRAMLDELGGLVSGLRSPGTLKSLWQRAWGLYRGAGGPRTAAKPGTVPGARWAAAKAAAAPPRGAVPGTRAKRPPIQSPGGAQLPAETRPEYLHRLWVDKMNRAGIVTDAIADQGGKADAGRAFVRKAKLVQGKATERLADIKRDLLDPLVRGLTDAGVSLEDLGDYLQLLHKPDRDRLMANRHGRQDGSGWTQAQADARWRELEKAHGARQGGRIKDLERHAAIVRKMRDARVDTLIRGGLISQAQARAWARDFGPDYVSLRHFEADEGMGTGQGFKIRGPESQKAKGRSTIAENPIAFMWEQLNRAVVRAEKNLADQEFGQFVVDNNLFRTSTGPTPIGDADFVYKKNGIEERVDVASVDPILDRALKNLSAEDTAAFVHTAGKLTRAFSQLWTNWNPGFTLPNFARDIGFATARILSREQGSFLDNGRLAASTLRGAFGPAMAATWRSARGKAAKGGWDRYAREFREDGGPVGFYMLRNAEELATDLAKQVGDAAPGAWATTKRMGRGLGQFVQDVNKAVENSTRLSFYRALRESGVPREDAAVAAKELTVNFEQKGEKSQMVGSFYAFFNAAVQGTTALARMMNTPKGKVVAGALVMAGLALDQYNRAVSEDEDENGVNDWDDIPEYVKERNLIVMTGGRTKPLMFPLPYGLNILFSTGRLAGAVKDRAIEPGKGAAALGSSLFSAFNPLGSDKHFYVPTAIKPVVESEVANRDWRGAPIVPEPFPGTAPKPDSERYWSTAPKWAQKIAKFLNERTGGDEVTPGSVLGVDTSISPETLDHYFKFALSGIARFGEDAVTTATKLRAGETPTVREIPLADRFVYEEPPSRQGTEYRAAVDEVEALYARYKHYRQRGQYEKIKAELPAPMLRVKSTLDRIDNRIRDLRKRGKAGADVDAEIRRLQTLATRAVNDARREAPAAP